MIPIVKCIAENTASSVIQLSAKMGRIEESVLKLFKKKEFVSVIDSKIQLYVTIFVSENNSNEDGYVHVDVSEDLEGDHDIYRLQCALTNLRFAGESVSCRIHIDTKEYQNQDILSEKKDVGSVKFVAVDPKWSFEQIILPEEVKQRLMRAISIIEHKDIIFDTLEYNKIDRSTKSIICFYGAPGTGKTITADAIAKYLGKKIMVSSYAQIESKYVGDGAKNLRAIFKAAEEQDAVLFMDEADSFLSKRIESTNSSSDKHYNRMSNELFQLLEDFNGCVIFSTNLMTDVDKAFKSRIIDSIMFPLPDLEGRIKMLKHMIPSKYLEKVFSNEELDTFALELKGFSGRDIRKSILLTYANIAPKIKEVGIDNFEWNKDDFCSGFNDVKSTVEIVEDIPVEDVQEFTDKMKEKRKLFEMAKHAISADGTTLDSREIALMNELSQQLLGVQFLAGEITPTMTMMEICKEASEEFKLSLVDIAIRVMTVDGDLSSNETQFVSKLCHLLEYNKSKLNALTEYAKSMADSYGLWINSLKI